MIKIFTISGLLTSENRKKVFPLLFDLKYLNTPKSIENYQLVENIINADVAIFPVDVIYIINFNNKIVFQEFLADAKINNVPVWIYTSGDFGKTFQEKLLNFRLAGYRSKLSEKNLIMPCFVSDPYQNILMGNWHYIEKSNKPNIGFVGQANGSISKFTKEYLVYLKQSSLRLIGKDSSDIQPFFPASLIRFRILKRIKANSKIDGHFILRSSYRASAKTNEEIELTTQDFYKNIESCLYTLCIRGAGNFSVRFYETLIMGRIPVLIDTDVQLPLSDIIKWEDHIVFATVDNVEQKLIDFHQSKSNEELIAIQFSNRKLIMEKLNRVDYFSQISKKYLNK